VGETEDSPLAEIVELELVPEETEARFVIGEVLRGQNNTVVGSTDQVQGEIRIDPNQPDQSSLGTFQIDAGSFTTDSSMRDRAIANFILQSGEYEKITFEATSINGIPEDASLGQTLNLQIQGNLTIREVTRQVTFDATVTPVSENRLEGSARATILREDFDLSIPSVPSVASVDEEMMLEIDLVARPSGGT
jgi:polyisoprenoid-binding protein YceI